MIGRLTGRLLEKKPPFLLLDVAGVGYEVEAPLSTFENLPEIGAETVLHTQLVVRDDAHLLFGFGSERERSMFRALTRVSGVGAKLALAVLSGTTPDEFARCVADNDISRLTRLPGVGKKTAERLVVEMRDKFDVPLHSGGLGGSVAQPGPGTAIADAVAGLVALGYRQSEAERALGQVETHGKSSEALIREVLRSMVR